MSNLFSKWSTQFESARRRPFLRLIQLAVLVAACHPLPGCGKSGKREAITRTGETISVPGTVLPSDIPEKFHLDKNQALHLEIPGYLIGIKSSPLRGGGNVLVFHDDGNITLLICEVKVSGFVEGLLNSKSVPARAVAVKVKDPDSYYVAFVPLKPKGVSWKKGQYAVAYQAMSSREAGWPMSARTSWSNWATEPATPTSCQRSRS